MRLACCITSHIILVARRCAKKGRRLVRAILFCSALLLVGALSCDSTDGPPSGNAGSLGGDGGGTGVGGASGGLPAGGAESCSLAFQECCDATDHKPCRGLIEAECVKHPYCDAIRAVPYVPGDQGESDLPLVYLGCWSFCTTALTEQLCIYQAADPTHCYRTASAGPAPDDGGWVVTSCHPEDLVQCDLSYGGAAP